MSKSSFYEILEDRIREDLRAEIEKEVEAKMRQTWGAASVGDSRTTHAASGAANTWAKSAAERVETWLASNVDPIKFKTNSRPARQAYSRGFTGNQKPKTHADSAHSKERETAKSTADSTSNESQVHSDTQKSENAGPTNSSYCATTSEELCAVELLARYGGGLTNPFTEKELKSAWRKAALSTHPDRFASSDGVTQAQTAVLFRELTKAFDLLEGRMTTTRPQKAA